VTGQPITVIVPSEAIEAVAERAAQLVLAELRRSDAGRSPWLAGAQAAADYLGMPRARIYKQLATIPHYRHGARLMFRRDDLDAWLERRREVE
jgi:excisionase family DNA binding protein